MNNITVDVKYYEMILRGRCNIVNYEITRLTLEETKCVFSDKEYAHNALKE